MRAVRNLKLPPHHTLPGPIKDAHFRFDAAQPVDISSNGRFHTIAVSVDHIELEVRYRTTPRYDSRAFRLVKAKLPSRTPLLPGPADVYVDGSLILTTPWKGTMGLGVLELGLGVEDGLRVARNIRYEETPAGLLGGSRRLATEITVEVASSLARPVELEILERIPIAGDDEVEVEELKATPTSRSWHGDDGPILKGGRSQKLNIPAGGRGTAVFQYVMVLSRNKTLQGGVRRG
ncbi:MAG: DUF4139 domain-containing protein [Proteobacteria bacterium]|nr:DUF4139 domain-containing protein [Pseudomonadota bacterium]